MYKSRFESEITSYNDDDILVVTYNGYSKTTLQDRIAKITYDAEKIKVLVVERNSERDNDYLTTVIDSLPNLHRVVMSNYTSVIFKGNCKLVDMLLDRNIIVDLRYGRFDEDKLITTIKSLVSTKNCDKLNNILLSYCSKCNDNLFQESPNRCLTEIKEWKKRICNRMLCKECVSSCNNHNNHNNHQFREPSIDKNLRKIMYEASGNYFWFQTNYIPECADHPENTDLVSLDESDTDCDCIKNQKRLFKYRLQLLKTSVIMLLDNIPSYVVSKVENFLNNDHSYPGYQK